MTIDLTDLGRQAQVPLPPDVSAMSRTLLVDTLGALIGGLRYPEMRALARELGADGEFGRLMTLGSAATWLDADSGGSIHPHGDRLPPVPTAHPAPHVLPVVLDAARSGVDDGSALRAFAAGVELGMRLGAGSSLRPGLHPHGVHGPAGAAVARVVLAGADAAAVGRAFARGAALPLAALLAVPMAGGTVRNAWTGLGTYYGALAARDTDDGDVDVIPQLFDYAVCDELDSHVLMGTTEPWRLRHSYLKPYACARWIHPALDALRQALSDHPGVPVGRIEVTTFAFAASLTGTRPRTDMAARFSLPFSLATFAVDGRLAADGFLPDRLVRPEVIDMAERITVTEDPDFTAALPTERPTTLRVWFTDGFELQVAVRNARGNPDDPLPPDEVAAKLRHNVGDVLPASLVDELAGWLVAEPGNTDVLGRIARVLLP
ncbi:MAG TPA: MmgE/PrpD family protein [Pseudonocardiaceae bacterium]|nr:MmgE/PrpD family protein [Pseudonocardiaceae bacterium]